MPPRSLVVAFLVVATPWPALAEEPNDPFEGMQGPKHLMRGAGLTEEQVARAREFRRATREQERELTAKLKALTEQFEARFIAEGPVDVAGLTSLGEQLLQVSSQLEHLKLDTVVKLRALLTPEQARRMAQAHDTLRALDAQARAVEPTIAPARP